MRPISAALGTSLIPVPGEPKLSAQHHFLAIAKAECLKESWPWVEPVALETKGLHWIVTTGADSNGRSVRILISQRTRHIVCKSFIRRSEQPVAQCE